MLGREILAWFNKLGLLFGGILIYYYINISCCIIYCRLSKALIAMAYEWWVTLKEFWLSLSTD